MKSIIFDLDLTLVDSTVAERARQSRNWSQVYSLISQFKVYDGLASVFQFIRSNGVKVAIVSTAPRPYVERVAAYHGIPYDCIVAYHDVQHHKPHPEGMNKAIELLGETPDHVVSFGDRAIDITASNSAGVTSVACLWGTKERFILLNSMPKNTIDDPTKIIELIK